MIRFFRSLISFARSFLSLIAPVAVFALHLGVMLCFINRWDSLVVVTLIPIWVWAGLGMGLSLIAWLILKSRLLILTFVIWFATGVFCADESPGLFRSLKAAIGVGETVPPDSSNRLRVVTVNCARGKLDAAEAVGPLEPDIVFLQETPDDAAGLEELARLLFKGEGSYLRSRGCAILARGALAKVDSETEFNGLIATLNSPGMPPVDLVNLHLQRAIPRKDFWSPAAWQTFTSVRRLNRKTLRKVVESFPERSGSPPQLIGGDFGTPANDDIFRMLGSLGYTDSYRKSGRGWGNTYTTGKPLLRIDQIWSSERLHSAQSKAVTNLHSDHRMVVSDFEFVGPGNSPKSR